MSYYEFDSDCSDSDEFHKESDSEAEYEEGDDLALNQGKCILIWSVLQLI